eukprot:305546_1
MCDPIPPPPQNIDTTQSFINFIPQTHIYLTSPISREKGKEFSNNITTILGKFEKCQIKQIKPFKVNAEFLNNCQNAEIYRNESNEFFIAINSNKISFFKCTKNANIKYALSRVLLAISFMNGYQDLGWNMSSFKLTISIHVKMPFTAYNSDALSQIKQMNHTVSFGNRIYNQRWGETGSVYNLRITDICADNPQKHAFNTTINRMTNACNDIISSEMKLMYTHLNYFFDEKNQFKPLFCPIIDRCKEFSNKSNKEKMEILCRILYTAELKCITTKLLELYSITDHLVIITNVKGNDINDITFESNGIENTYSISSAAAKATEYMYLKQLINKLKHRKYTYVYVTTGSKHNKRYTYMIPPKQITFGANQRTVTKQSDIDLNSILILAQGITKKLKLVGNTITKFDNNTLSAAQQNSKSLLKYLDANWLELKKNHFKTDGYDDEKKNDPNELTEQWNDFIEKLKDIYWVPIASEPVHPSLVWKWNKLKNKNIYKYFAKPTNICCKYLSWLVSSSVPTMPFELQCFALVEDMNWDTILENKLIAQQLKNQGTYINHLKMKNSFQPEWTQELIEKHKQYFQRLNKNANNDNNDWNKDKWTDIAGLTVPKLIYYCNFEVLNGNRYVKSLIHPDSIVTIKQMKLKRTTNL